MFSDPHSRYCVVNHFRWVLLFTRGKTEFGQVSYCRFPTAYSQSYESEEVLACNLILQHGHECKLSSRCCVTSRTDMEEVVSV